MGAQISFLDAPHASDSLQEMPGYYEPGPSATIDSTLEKVAILEGASDSTISGGTFNAAGRDVITVNNITITILDTTPLKDIKILDWLSQINYRALQMFNHELAIAGTCAWFLRSKIFQQWLEGKFRILWGTGMPGAGKTILASIVIDYLQQYAKLHGTKVALAFAYCRYTEPVPVRQILAALVRQLLERYPFLHPLIEPIYEHHRREMTKPSKAQLLELLSHISRVFEILFCALDGLDEAAPDIQFDLLESLSSVRAHFFITSRPLQPLHSVLPDAYFFTIAAHDEDIEHLIQDKLDRDPGFRTLSNTSGYANQHRRIVSKVKKAAGGMFLHAALQVETLRHATNIRHALESLEGLPPTINDTYSMTLERINAQPGKKPQIARRILSWLTYARRGLTVDELRYALAVKITNPLPPNAEIVDPMLLDDMSLLLPVCCGLVVVNKPLDGNQSLRLVHFTAVDFLKKIISPTEAHFLLASTCIRRIISADADTRSAHRLPENSIRTSQERPLVGYALNFWADHGSHCVSPGCEAMDPFVLEVAYLFLRRCSQVPNVYNDVALPWTVLCTVIWCLPDVVTPLLAMNDPRIVQAMAEQVNSQTPVLHHSWTPLALAVRRPDTQVLCALLKLPNIDFNARTGRGTALLIATEMGNGEAIKLLLANPRVDVNARFEQTVIRSSGWKGVEVAEADPEDGATALIMALAAGLETIAWLLLERIDVDVNLANRDGWTPLMFAILNGNFSVVKRLLRHPNIEIDAINNEGETALTLAVRWDNLEIHRLLLKFLSNR
ncbi:hypothetical protein BKA70DRAFT_1150116 [Coprinopsis sp. MPI-PUGE-AT-0042]|nr:hypothetical protein BKA70DRAFT_1150116 [Coprinopsis sp. MPI-PUGE-AT-0042]